MLIEFRFTNFRSFKDETVLSLVASKDDQHFDENVTATGLSSIQNVLRSAVIYGPNASGKSNLLVAFENMRILVARSAQSAETGANNFPQPFLLDPKTSTEPTSYEITFLIKNVRYQYGYSVFSGRIDNEYLLVYRTAKPQQWFSRKYDHIKKAFSYEFSTFFTGQRRLWQDSTRADALFLSTAVLLNSEQLRPVYNWIVNQCFMIRSDFWPNFEFTLDRIGHDQTKTKILDFLTSADISISDIRSSPGKSLGIDIEYDPRIDKTSFRAHAKDQDLPEFIHTVGQTQAVFKFENESLGTQRLFALVGPLLDILQSGKVLFVDELDSSLHPLLVRRIVSFFHHPVWNVAGAQLIFTTHDTSLLDSNLFRRDQFWFVEKDGDQASHLYPLSDFSPRKKEALESGYLTGRYGALPIFRDLSE